MVSFEPICLQLFIGGNYKVKIYHKFDEKFRETPRGFGFPDQYVLSANFFNALRLVYHFQWVSQLVNCRYEKHDGDLLGFFVQITFFLRIFSLSFSFQPQKFIFAFFHLSAFRSPHFINGTRYRTKLSSLTFT